MYLHPSFSGIIMLVTVYFLVYVEQQSAGQLMEARKLLESAQSLERQKQQLDFQRQQLVLQLQQAKEAHAMEQELQKTMKMQLDQASNSAPIKMVLRKRYPTYTSPCLLLQVEIQILA